MSHHHAVGTLRTPVPLALINAHVRVPRDVEQCFSGHLVRLVEFLELALVKPDAAAAIVADVDRNPTNRLGSQGPVTRGTLHGTPLLWPFSTHNAPAHLRRAKVPADSTPHSTPAGTCSGLFGSLCRQTTNPSRPRIAIVHIGHDQPATVGT